MFPHRIKSLQQASWIDLLIEHHEEERIDWILQ